MNIADRCTYLLNLVNELNMHWPQNRTINIVCHGHSVPSGYFATPMVDTFNAYPHLIHKGLKERFPFAVINVIVTGVGGETSELGLKRFKNEVLCHKPDIITIDYGLNDRSMGLERAEAFWSSMIEQSLEENIKLLLFTPTMDIGGVMTENITDLKLHADLIRKLAMKYEVGLVDSYAAFGNYIKKEGELSDLLSWGNHPNSKGHELVRNEFLRWFPLVY
ncbi:MAG: SGNH/GDSL hydrolase family protein [Ruminiclostridium sp.]|nr:SGNH/GDSL hydrolase family protein [Ruminiclostridium sp.]